MEVRASDPACLAYFSYLLTRNNMSPNFNIDCIHVAIEADKPMAVVEDDCVAVEKVVACSDDTTGRGRDNRRTFVGSDIHARVRRSWLAIKEPLVAE